ncbi:MAG: PCRF domain-containing protein, partial [Clostridia bacterium]|nr:PCRF domain-containing protein [Clostridia bacterium]
MSHFNLPGLGKELEELKEQLTLPEVWSDVERSKTVNQRIRVIEDTLEESTRLASHIDDIGVLVELGEESGDEELTDEVLSELSKAEEEVEALRLKTLLKGKYDGCNAIITLHAGAGGTEAQDW